MLGVISRSPGGLEPVFNAMLENALRICEAKLGMLLRYSDGEFVAQVMVGAPPALVDALLHKPFRPPPGNPIDRMVRTKKLVHTLDAAAEENKPLSARLAGARSHIVVPLLKDDELIGAVSIYRQEVRPFTDKQIELLTSFASQAVIAIENARLLSELREALEQQTATSEVLRVISSSPGELAPVFEAMLANATRLCEATYGILWLREGDAFRIAALEGALAEEHWRKGTLYRPSPEVPLARVIQTRTPVHVPDMREERSYLDGDPLPRAAVEVAGMRTLLSVPMLKENDCVGAIAIYRTEVRPFNDKQIELVTNFASQAIIAIENTRLLNELRESLQQQTATAEVLGVISSSPGELQPVFQAMLANAVRVIGSKFGTMYLRDGEAFRVAAMHSAPRAFFEALTREPLFRPGPDTALGRTAITRRVVQIADLEAEAKCRKLGPRAVVAMELGGVRTVLSVPMLKDNELVGTIAIYRAEVRPFTDKQIKLVQNLAAQAVIAIENTRLLRELRQRTNDLSEALEQQTDRKSVV